MPTSPPGPLEGRERGVKCSVMWAPKRYRTNQRKLLVSERKLTIWESLGDTSPQVRSQYLKTSQGIGSQTALLVNHILVRGSVLDQSNGSVRQLFVDSCHMAPSRGLNDLRATECRTFIGSCSFAEGRRESECQWLGRASHNPRGSSRSKAGPSFQPRRYKWSLASEMLGRPLSDSLRSSGTPFAWSCVVLLLGWGIGAPSLHDNFDRLVSQNQLNLKILRATTLTIS